MSQTHYVAGWKSDIAVRWRAPTWSEFRQFQQALLMQSPMEVYFELYRVLLIEGLPVEDSPAGIVEFVGRTMMETNPFGGRLQDIEHAIAVKRNGQDFLENARTLVAGLFRYTFEEIDQWDADTFFDRFAKAEFLSQRELNPIRPPTEEQQAADKKRPAPPRPKKPMNASQQAVWERVQERQRTK